MTNQLRERKSLGRRWQETAEAGILLPLVWLPWVVVVGAILLPLTLLFGRRFWRGLSA